MAAVAVARNLDGGGRAVGDIAVDDAVAVVHGTDKLARALLLAPCACPAQAQNAVAGLRGEAANPSGRTFSSSVPAPGSERAGRLAACWLGAGGRWGCAWRLCWSLRLPVVAGVRRLGWPCSCGGAGGADALAIVPAIGRGWPQFRLGLRSILSSCVYFLALCSLVHSVFSFSHSRPVLRQSLSIPSVCRLSRFGRGTPRPTVKLLRSIEKLVGERHSANYLP